VRGVQFHHPVPAAVDGSEEVGKDYKHASADLQVRVDDSTEHDFIIVCGVLHVVVCFCLQHDYRLRA
jgi:hypothetical protein